MDILSEALNFIQFKGTVYCQTEFSAPWGVQWYGVPQRAGFFMVVRGGCLMESPGRTMAYLAPGDFVMHPHPRAIPYVLKDAADSSVIDFDDIIEPYPMMHRIVQYGGGGATTRLVMGCFELNSNTSNPFMASLPEFIHVKAEDLQSEPWLDTTLRFLASECSAEKPGGSLAIGRLTDLLFIQAIRVYIAQEMKRPNSTGWLKAMVDPQIGAALSLIHESPHAPWTVASLAESVNMSRSAFAAKFSELTEATPLDYVTTMRMNHAQRLLESGESVSAIACSVGYKSEAAFAKAFKRTTGVAPGAVRKGKRG